MSSNEILNKYVEALEFLLIKKKKKVGIKKRISLYSEETNAVMHSELRIKQSVTNVFMTFSANGLVLFSCSAGSAGMKKKERRRKQAMNAMSESFCKFVRYYLRTNGDFSIFSNIIVFLNAPVIKFKVLLYTIEKYLKTIVRKKNKDVLVNRLLIYNRYRKSYMTYIDALSYVRTRATRLVTNLFSKVFYI
jgi:hypothetical protein